MGSEGLAAVPLFRTVDDATLAHLARRRAVRDVAAGDTVAHAGEPARHLLVVERGTLCAVHDTRDGARLRLATVTGPRAVDKAAVLDDGRHLLRWTALTAGRVLLLPAGLFRTLVADVASVRAHVLTHLAAQVNQDRRVRMRHALPRPVDRVADWLAHADRDRGGVVRLPGGQQGLGEELGLSRVTVNRALSALARAGAIRTGPRVVRIVDPTLLAVLPRP